MTTQQAERWAWEFAKRILGVAHGEHARQLVTSPLKQFAAKPHSPGFTLMTPFKSKVAEPPAELTSPSSADDEEDGANERVGQETGWGTTTKEVPQAPVKKINFGEEPEEAKDSATSAIEAEREKMERDTHLAAFFALLHLDGLATKAFQSALLTYLKSKDRHLGHHQERPVYSEKGLHFSMVLTFIQGELEPTPVLQNALLRLALVNRSANPSFVEYLRELKILKEALEEETGIDLYKIEPKEHKKGDVLFELAFSQSPPERQGMLDLSPNKIFPVLLEKLENMTSTDRHAWEERNSDKEKIREKHDQRMREIIQGITPTWSQANEANWLKFYRTFVRRPKEHNDNRKTPGETRRDSKKSDSKQSPKGSGSKQDQAGKEKSTSWTEDEDEEKPDGTGTSNGAAAKDGGKNPRGGKNNRGGGRGKGRGRRPRRGSPPPAPPPPPKVPPPPTVKRARFEDQDNADGAVEMESFRVEALPKELAANMMFNKANKDNAKTLYDVELGDEGVNNPLALAHNTLKAPMTIKGAEGKEPDKKLIVALDTQSEVSMIGKGVLRDLKQQNKATAFPKMTKQQRETAQVFDKGVIVRGVGGSRRMKGAALLAIKYDGNDYCTLPFLIVDDDVLPTGADGLVSHQAILSLFSEQQFGRLAFKEAASEETGDATSAGAHSVAASP